MKFTYYFLLLLVSTISINSYSQKKKTITPVKVTLKPITTMVVTPTMTVRPTYIRLTNWEKTNIVGFDLNEIAFMNWSAGGSSSISGLVKGNFTRIYTTETYKWVNELIVRYGINLQDGQGLRKTDDEFRVNSTFGYRKNETSNWYHSAKFNFNTQFSNGYNYPNTDYAISKPFAPAYTFLGTGADYFDKEKQFDIYISPLTFKNTLVLDKTLAEREAFGVKNGQHSKSELGILITNYYKKEIWENITMENRLSLYSDYLNNFGNIDVDWKLQVDFIVNQYVSANIGTRILYDDDVKTTEEIDGETVMKGPKLQLKQSLGIGLVYNF